MKNRMITAMDYQRLLARMNYVPSTEILSVMEKQLYYTLLSAFTVSPQKIPRYVVTMNSRVQLQELLTQRIFKLTLTYPENANNLKNKISILSPIGIALIGRKIGDQVSWESPAGIRHYEILDIPYQPEAIGEYSL